MRGDKWVPRKTFVYDVGAYDVQLYSMPWQWNVFEPLTLEQAQLKAAAFACYSSQTPGGAHITSEVVGMAAAIGAVRGLEYAEQYALLKEVR